MTNTFTAPLLPTSYLPTSYLDATGNIDYGMTNDYMFRAILQENTVALTGLLCSLLHLNPKDIISVEITNPILLGNKIDSKDFGYG